MNVILFYFKLINHRLSDAYSLYPSLKRRPFMSLIRRLQLISVATPTAFKVILKKKWITVAYPTALLSLNRRHEGYFLKKISPPSKKGCHLSDILHLTDGKLRCRLTDGFEICRITDDKFPTLKKINSVVHATGKCRKSDNTAVRFLVEM